MLSLKMQKMWFSHKAIDMNYAPSEHCWWHLHGTYVCDDTLVQSSNLAGRFGVSAEHCCVNLVILQPL